MKHHATVAQLANDAKSLAFAFLTLLACISAAPALCLPDPSDDEPELGSSRLAKLRHGPQINHVAVELKIRELSSQLTKEPDNKECRLNLAQALESLGQWSLGQEDFLNAWRYFQGAAHVLNYPKDKSLKKRGDEDAKKAADCRQRRVDYLSGLKFKGLVFVSFNWHKIKDLDAKAANDYIQQIGLPIRKNWSVAKRMHTIKFGEFAGPRIIVAFNIHRDGKVSDVILTKSCGRPAIDQLAMQAVQAVTKEVPLLPQMGQVLPVEAQFAK